MATRRKFTRELKISLIHEMEAGKSVAEICREHAIHPTMLYKWKREYEKNPDDAFKGNGNICTLEGKLAEKDRLIGKLYAENEFLKRVLSVLKKRCLEVRNQE